MTDENEDDSDESGDVTIGVPTAEASGESGETED